MNDELDLPYANRRRRPAYYYQYPRSNFSMNNVKSNSSPYTNAHTHGFNPKPPIVKQEKEQASANEAKAFEIFGIKLHFDDLLILALLFFLYKEKADDPWLFIALVLLLLT